MTLVIDGMWFGRRFCFMAYYRERGRKLCCFGNDRAEAIGLLAVSHALFHKNNSR